MQINLNKDSIHLTKTNLNFSLDNKTQKLKFYQA